MRTRKSETRNERLCKNWRNPVGVDESCGQCHRVARSSQPWAGGHNPFGIADEFIRPRASRFRSIFCHKAKGGFALIAVLVVIMLASMVAISLLFRMRAEDIA